MSTAPVPERLQEALRKELLRLAQHEEDIAVSEAEAVNYWQATPIIVAIHRPCAAALSGAADEPLTPSHSQPGRG